MLVATPGVLHTRSELDEVLPGIALDIKEETARAAGMSLTDIAMQLNAQTEGVIGGSVIEATEELPVGFDWVIKTDPVWRVLVRSISSMRPRPM